jgi:hypothetical protein
VVLVPTIPKVECIGLGVPELKGIDSMFEIQYETNSARENVLRCRWLNGAEEELEGVQKFHFRQPRKQYSVKRNTNPHPHEDDWKKIILVNVHAKKKMEENKKSKN